MNTETVFLFLPNRSFRNLCKCREGVVSSRVRWAVLCGTVGFLEAAADAPAKSTQSESDQQTLRCSRWWKILMLILIMAMVTVVTPPPPMHALKKVFYLILQHSGWGMVGPASRRANAWLVSSSRLSPTARCRCLFFCKADFSNAMPT